MGRCLATLFGVAGLIAVGLLQMDPNKNRKRLKKPSGRKGGPAVTMLSETEELAQEQARSHERQLRAGNSKHTSPP